MHNPSLHVQVAHAAKVAGTVPAEVGGRLAMTAMIQRVRATTAPNSSTQLDYPIQLPHDTVAEPKLLLSTLCHALKQFNRVNLVHDDCVQNTAGAQQLTTTPLQSNHWCTSPRRPALCLSKSYTLATNPCCRILQPYMLSQSVPLPGPGRPMSGSMSGTPLPPPGRGRWKSSGRQPSRPSGSANMPWWGSAGERTSDMARSSQD